MNTKKYLIASVAVFVFLSLYGWLYHGVLLKGLYMETMQFWRPVEEMQRLMYLEHLSTLLFSLLFVLIYIKGIEAGKNPVGQGFRYGLLVGLLLMIPNSLGLYPYVPYPAKLLAAWFVGDTIKLVLAGVVAGKLYQKTA